MNYSKTVLKLLNKNQKYTLSFLFILMLTGMFLEIGGISLLLPTLAIIMDEQFIFENKDLFGSFFGNIKDLDHSSIIIFIIAILIIYYVFKTIFLTLMSSLLSKFTYEVKKSVSQILYNGYIQKDFAFHLKKNSSEIIRNITSEVNLFIDGILKQVLTLGLEGLIILGITIFLFIFQPLSMMIISISLGLSSYIFYKYNKNKILEWGKLRQKHEAKKVQNLQQGIAGIKEVKLHNKEVRFSKDFFYHNSVNADADKKQYFLSLMPRIWLETLSIITILGVVAFLIMLGNSPSSIVPTLGVFAAAAFRVLPSVTRVMHSVQTLRFSYPVSKLLDEEFTNFNLEKLNLDIHKEKDFEIDKLPFRNEIEIKNISFKYFKDEDFVLRDLSLKIKRGDTIGIIGESGSGKTTFINLFLGLLEIENGYIKVDGIDTKENIKGWQTNIGYVPQSVYISDDDIMKNVAFGIEEKLISTERVWKCLELSQMLDLVESFPNKLNTNLGEGGVRLSGGQVQRIGIARALYNDPDILVFDEASSALDSSTEKEISNSIYSLGGDKTIIMIAHRFTTLSGCNKIFEISKKNFSNTYTYDDLKTKT